MMTAIKVWNDTIKKTFSEELKLISESIQTDMMKGYFDCKHSFTEDIPVLSRVEITKYIQSLGYVAVCDNSFVEVSIKWTKK